MRALPSTPPENRDCAYVKQYYSSQEKYDTFKETQDVFNHDSLASLDTYFSNQYYTDKSSSDPAAQQRMTQKLGNLTYKKNFMNYFKRCINNDSISRQDKSSEIYTIQKTLDEKREELKDKEEIAAQAKERASLLEKPYNKTTVWEAWFPLGRPLKKESVPVLLGLSIFFLVLSLGIFLRLASIELQFTPQGYSLDRIPLIGSFFTPSYQ